MSPPAHATRPPWEDRWTEPTFEQLFEPVEEQRRKIIESLIEGVAAFDGVEQSLVWYGSAWKWTLRFALDGRDGDEEGILAYIVPTPEAPIFCIPLRRKMIEKLPMRRLSKYVRDGIRYAKFAVDVHWAIWTPNAGTEVEALLDLVKRRHKLLTAE